MLVDWDKVQSGRLTYGRLGAELEGFKLIVRQDRIVMAFRGSLRFSNEKFPISGKSQRIDWNVTATAA